ILVLSRTSLGHQWARRLATSSTVRERVYYWETAYRLWREKPLAGYGAGAFELRYPMYRIPGSGETKYPHNWIALIASEFGLVGLALFAGWAAIALGLRLRTSRSRPLATPGCKEDRGTESRLQAERETADLSSTRGIPPEGGTPCSGSQESAAMLDPLRATAALGAALLLWNGLFEYSLSVRELYVDLCLLLGIAAGLRGAPRPADARLLAAVPTALLLGALAVAWSALFRPDRALAFEEQSRAALAEAARARAEGDSLRASLCSAEARSALESARRLQPNDPWILDAMAQVLQTPEQQDPAAARRLMEDAVALYPHSATLRSDWASTLFAAGERKRAIEEWDRAIGLYPLSPLAYEKRALALAHMGRFTLALEDARHARRLSRRTDEVSRDLEQRILALRDAAGR
ncbi:MAG: O-antigen ligase family protein, partial [Candidatus Sumerlaeota bacterium]|nr:O-antigen ligase family protein [Candidatus Sumerlaeota bacterium]